MTAVDAESACPSSGVHVTKNLPKIIEKKFAAA